MKRKLILIFLLIILSVCIFAFSSSASGYINLDDLPNDIIYNSCYVDVYSLTYYAEEDNFESALGYELSFYCFRIMGSNDYDVEYIGLFQTENWLKYIKDHNITNADELCSSIYNGCELGYWKDYWTFTHYIIESYSNEIWNCCEELLARQNAPTYEDGISQGKIDGVAEFKASEEYKSQYTTGYTEGVSNFKLSEEYKEALLLEKQIGQAEGKSLYLESEEYENALQAEYDNGYDTAVKDQSKAEFKTEFVTLIGSLGLIILVLSVIFVFSKKKHKRR